MIEILLESYKILPNRNLTEIIKIVPLIKKLSELVSLLDHSQ